MTMSAGQAKKEYTEHAVCGEHFCRSKEDILCRPERTKEDNLVYIHLRVSHEDYMHKFSFLSLTAPGAGWDISS